MPAFGEIRHGESFMGHFATLALTACLALTNALAVAQTQTPLASNDVWEWHAGTNVGFWQQAPVFDSKGGFWLGASYFDGSRWTTYTPANTNGGLLGDDLVMVDRQGSVWFLSKQGLSRFDGKQWINYSVKSTGGALYRGEPVGLAQDQKGDIWLAYNHEVNGSKDPAGVIQFDGKTWKRHKHPCLSIYAMAIDRRDTVWLACGNDAASLNGNVWSMHRPTENGGPDGAFNIAMDRNGVMWFGSIDKVSRFDGKRWATFSVHPDKSEYRVPEGGLFKKSFKDNKRHPKEVHFTQNQGAAVDGNGHVWMAGFPSDSPQSEPGFYRFDGQTWTRFAERKSWRWPASVAVDPQGKTWFGSAGATKGLNYHEDVPGELAQVDAGIPQRTFTGENTRTEPSNNVSALAMDTSGTVLAASEGKVSVYNGKQWRPVVNSSAADTILDGREITALASSDNGDQWLALRRYDKPPSLARIDASGLHEFTGSQIGVSFTWIYAMATDALSNLWVATDKGALKYDGRRWTVVTRETTAGGLLGDRVRGVAIDAQGVWFGGDGGVSRYDGKSWTHFTPQNTGDGLGSNVVGLLAFDRKGRLWAVAEASLSLRRMGGLAMYDGTKWQTYTASNSGQKFLDHRISAMAPDNKGGVWIITTEDSSNAFSMDSARHFDGSTWRSLNWENTRNALPGKKLLAVTVDQYDNAWISVKDYGLAVHKAPGQVSKSTARVLPWRTQPTVPQFEEHPDITAAKAAAAKAKDDAAAAWEKYSLEEYQEEFCYQVSQVSGRNGFGSLLAKYEKTRFSSELFWLSSSCKSDILSGDPPVPMIQMMFDLAKARLLDTLLQHVLKKPEGKKLMVQLLNAKNTKQETLLDYIERNQANDYVTSEAVAPWIKFACANGGVYSKYGKTC